MPIVVVPTAYRGPTRGEAEITVEGASVLDCLKAVEVVYEGFLGQVLDDAGAVHRFVKLFVNEQQIDSKELDRPLQEVDRLEILAAIAGG